MTKRDRYGEVVDDVDAGNDTDEPVSPDVAKAWIARLRRQLKARGN